MQPGEFFAKSADNAARTVGWTRPRCGVGVNVARIQPLQARSFKVGKLLMVAKQQNTQLNAGRDLCDMLLTFCSLLIFR